MAKDAADKNTWKDFIWNPRTQEFMGRTASSWGLILLFYLVFYIFLAGMFALTMYVMLQTLDDHTPTWQDRLSTPGMMIKPEGSALEIVYNIKKTESWDGYITILDKFLGPYNNSVQVVSSEECPPDRYFLQEDSGDVKNNPKRSCQFNRTELGNCSGIDDRYYGYQDGQPCIIVKLNRVIKMLPGINGQAPFVTCGGKRYKVGKDEWKEDVVGDMVYYPPNGTFNLMYYPYYGKKAQMNYSQPLVAVKFLNITRDADVNIECIINANNIPAGSERDKFAGKVSFKLRINTEI